MGNIKFSSVGTFALSLGLHLVFFVALFAAFVPASYRLPGKPGANIIQVQAVSQRQIDQVNKARQQRLQAIKRAKLQKLKAQRLAKQRRLRALRLAKQKLLAIKKQRLAKKRRQLAIVTARQKLLAQRQQLSKQLLDRQLQQEATRLQQVRSVQQQGVIDRYKAELVAAIEQQWFLPPGTDPDLSCRLRVQLAPGGVVLSVKLLSSSGNPAVDRSARTAVLQASPLPVPNNPALFDDDFRVLNLTMHPKNIISNST